VTSSVTAESTNASKLTTLDVTGPQQDNGTQKRCRAVLAKSLVAVVNCKKIVAAKSVQNRRTFSEKNTGKVVAFQKYYQKNARRKYYFTLGLFLHHTSTRHILATNY